MRYLGNKTRIAKHIVPIVTRTLDNNSWYVEPFVGACGIMQAVNYRLRVGVDSCPYIIALMRAVQGNWIPPLITEDEYNAIKAAPEKYEPSLVGFAGYGCSFGGKWFAGFARGGYNKDGTPRNHVAESIRNLQKLATKINQPEVVFYCDDYDKFQYQERDVIYCDPPYKTNTKFKEGFDHDKFWAWAVERNKTNWVYVSEYTAPEDWIPVWEMEHKTGIHHGFKTHPIKVEKLFIHESRL